MRLTGLSILVYFDMWPLLLFLVVARPCRLRSLSSCILLVAYVLCVVTWMFVIVMWGSVKLEVGLAVLMLFRRGDGRGARGDMV